MIDLLISLIICHFHSAYVPVNVHSFCWVVLSISDTGTSHILILMATYQVVYAATDFKLVLLLSPLACMKKLIKIFQSCKKTAL